jgi:integrase
MALTDRALAALVAKPPKEETEIRDTGCKGMRVRILPSGVVTFRFQGRPGDVSCANRKEGQAEVHRHTLVLPYPETSLKAARAAVEDYRQTGGHSNIGKQGELTIGQLCDLFFAGPIKTRRKRPEKVADILTRDFKPIRDLPISAFDWSVASKPVQAAVDRKAPAHAQKVLQVMRQLGRWANGKHLPNDPTTSLSAKDLGAHSTPRNRTLDAKELGTFLGVLRTSDFGERLTRLGIELLLTTGLRSGELRTALWSDIDTDDKLIRVRPENLKLSPAQVRQLGEGYTYAQPLSDYALELVEELGKLTRPAQGDGFLLLGFSKKGECLSEKALNRTLGRLQRSNAELKKLRHFTCHDFRRSLSSWASEVFDPLSAQEVLGHSLNAITRSGVASTYDTSQRIERKRKVLDGWGLHLTDLASGKTAKVVKLKRAAR